MVTNDTLNEFVEILPRELQGREKYRFFQNHFHEKCRQCGRIIMFEEETPTFIEGF
jgi:Fe2+ or Zn2+ uptake regulation protein